MINAADMRRFRELCDYYRFDIICISSGCAYIHALEGDAIITLPAHGCRWGSLSDQVSARSRRGRFQAIQGRVNLRTPEEVWRRLDAVEAMQKGAG